MKDVLVNDGSCVNADELYQPGFKCDGSVGDELLVCEISGCTDNELVAAYQKIVPSCDADGGQHTLRAGQCSTHGCDAAQLEAAFDALQAAGQCPLLEEEETAETPTTAAPAPTPATAAKTCSEITTAGECCTTNGCGWKDGGTLGQCGDAEDLTGCSYDISCTVEQLTHQSGSCSNGAFYSFPTSPRDCQASASVSPDVFAYFAYDTSTSTCTYWMACTGNKNDGLTVMNTLCPSGR